VSVRWTAQQDDLVESCGFLTNSWRWLQRRVCRVITYEKTYEKIGLN
jgi:hypothetical protein